MLDENLPPVFDVFGVQDQADLARADRIRHQIDHTLQHAILIEHGEHLRNFSEQFEILKRRTLVELSHCSLPMNSHIDHSLK